MIKRVKRRDRGSEFVVVLSLHGLHESPDMFGFVLHYWRIHNLMV